MSNHKDDFKIRVSLTEEEAKIFAEASEAIRQDFKQANEFKKDPFIIRIAKKSLNSVFEQMSADPSNKDLEKLASAFNSLQIWVEHFKLDSNAANEMLETVKEFVTTEIQLGPNPISAPLALEYATALRNVTIAMLDPSQQPDIVSHYRKNEEQDETQKVVSLDQFRDNQEHLIRAYKDLEFETLEITPEKLKHALG